MILGFMFIYVFLIFFKYNLMLNSLLFFSNVLFVSRLVGFAGGRVLLECVVCVYFDGFVFFFFVRMFVFFSFFLFVLRIYVCCNFDIFFEVLVVGDIFLGVY